MASSTTASAVAAVTADTFVAEVLESDRPVVVDFWAAWCAPCRVMASVMEELARERDDLRFAKVDVEAEQELAARYGVLSMPTFVVFRHGTPVASLAGSRPKRRLVAELEQALAR